LGSTGNAENEIPKYWSGSAWHFTKQINGPRHYVGLNNNRFKKFYHFEVRLFSFKGEIFASTSGSPSANATVRNGSSLERYVFNGIELYSIDYHPSYTPSSNTWFSPNDIDRSDSKSENDIYLVVTLSDEVTVPTAYTNTPTINFGLNAPQGTKWVSMSQDFYGPITSNNVSQTLQLININDNSSLYTNLKDNQLVFKGTVSKAINHPSGVNSFDNRNLNDEFRRPNSRNIGRYPFTYYSSRSNFNEFSSVRSSTLSLINPNPSGTFEYDFIASEIGLPLDIDKPALTGIQIKGPKNKKGSLRAGDAIKVIVSFDQKISLASSISATLNIGTFESDGQTHTSSRVLSEGNAVGNNIELVYTLQERDFVMGLGTIALTSLNISETAIKDYYTDVTADVSNLSSFQSLSSLFYIRLSDPRIIDIDTNKGRYGYGRPTEDGTHPTSGVPFGLTMKMNYKTKFQLQPGYNRNTAYYKVYYDNGATQIYYWKNRITGGCNPRPGDWTSSIFEYLGWHIEEGCDVPTFYYPAPGDTPDLNVVAVEFVGIDLIDPEYIGNIESTTLNDERFIDLKSSYREIEDNGDGTYTLVTKTPKSLADNRAIVQTGALPTIISVEGKDGTYSSGTVTLTLTTSEGVYLSGSNSPTLIVNVKNESGSTTKTADFIGTTDLRTYVNYDTTTTTTKLNFSLSVDSGDYTYGKLNAVALTLPSGYSIRDENGSGNNLDLTMPLNRNISDTSDIYIDNSGPVVESIEVNSRIQNSP
jgi:hypothetical protein